MHHEIDAVSQVLGSGMTRSKEISLPKRAHYYRLALNELPPSELTGKFSALVDYVEKSVDFDLSIAAVNGLKNTLDETWKEYFGTHAVSDSLHTV